MSPFGWRHQLAEIRDALRALPTHLAAAQSSDVRSIRDLVQEIEARVESTHSDDQRRDDLAEVLVTPARQGRIAALEARVREIDQTVKILCDHTHESSLHVAGPVLRTPVLPATIMQGTPDTDPSGDGASVEGPSTTTGPSTSEAQHPISAYVASQVRRILAARRIPRKALAPILGMTPSGVSRLINGHTTWMAPEIALVARFFGIPVDDLFPPQTWLEDRP